MVSALICEVFSGRNDLSFDVCVILTPCRRGLNPPHRVKSISMTTFSDAEIKQLKEGGNEVSLPSQTNMYLSLPAQHSTTQHNTIQHNTTQHNTAQHNTTQHNTAHMIHTGPHALITTLMRFVELHNAHTHIHTHTHTRLMWHVSLTRSL